jgi:hypothetical protein
MIDRKKVFVYLVDRKAGPRPEVGVAEVQLVPWPRVFGIALIKY